MFHTTIYTTCLICALLFSGTFSGQTEKQVIKLIHQLDSSKTAAELKKLNSGFDRYLRSNPKLWQAYYYTALTNILIAFESQGHEIRTYCDKANLDIARADSISPGNSELMVLRSMSAAAMINSDKRKNAVKYGMLANKSADKAIQLDKENPRAYLLKAKALQHVPPAMGGGLKPAIRNYEISIGKFKEPKQKTDTDPSWGLAMAQKELKECQSKLKKSKDGK